MRIKEVLKEKGFTYKMLADEMDVTEQAIKNMLNSPSITTNTVERIARAVNVNEWELFATRDEVIGEELTALIYHKGAHYRATTLEELRGIVEELERATAEATSAETSGRSVGR